jgi:RIO kinase 1
MRIPNELRALIDDGAIDTVLRPLRRGKEAAVFVVRCGDEKRCAKVYHDHAQRSFQARAQYREGRHVRGSRQARAVGRRTRFGRREEEAAWKNTEVDALFRLHAAGVRVPRPFAFIDGVLVMELVTDGDGDPAPWLGEVTFTAAEARAQHAFLVEQIKRMLCAGLVHGDLSAYNILYGRDGPVIIDLPQAVDAAANNNAQAMLLRDVANVTATLARFAPELAGSRHGAEMWSLFARGELRPDSELSGRYDDASGPVDVDALRAVIEDARNEAERRERGRAIADGRLEPPDDDGEDAGVDDDAPVLPRQRPRR